MSESDHTSLFYNPWFYGFVVVVCFLFFLSGILSPRLKDPWFWQSNDRLTNSNTLSRKDLHRRLRKHPSEKAIGEPGAPVTVTEYSHFLCDPCRTYAREFMPYLLREFVQTGTVYYRVRHAPLPDQTTLSRRILIASECAADQDRFWQFRHRATRLDTAPTRRDLMKWADRLDLDNPDEYRRCVRNNRRMDIVRDDFIDAQQHGITTIPSLVINGRSVSGVDSYKSVRQRIRTALHQARSDTQGGQHR